VLELLATTVDFLVACLDTGANRKVFGMQQAEAYIKFTGGTGTIKIVGSKTVYQFGCGKNDTVGSPGIRVPITAEFMIIRAVRVLHG